MRLPGALRDEILDAVQRLEPGAALAGVQGVGGGCINNGAKVGTSTGRAFFLKWNPSAPPGMFEAEADGLRALRKAASRIDGHVRPRIPEPLAVGGGSSEADWLIMEWIPAGGPSVGSDERLGRGLAALHAEGSGDAFGWHRDNRIGSLPQSNRERTSWADFWREERIVPQLEAARRSGYLGDPLLDDVVARIDVALEGVEAPELLHGDLWSGNSYVSEDGAPVLVDPAVYRGDGEVDLAMTELFGGFGAGFYDAYREARGVGAAYESHRRALYQLYYLLVHVNLFGRSYVSGCRRAAEAVLTAVGR